MQIATTLLPHAVLQRNARNVCDAVATGTTHAAGTVRVRVTRGGKPVRGLADAVAGRAARGRFTVRLAGLPAGGPYDVALRIIDAAGTVLERTVVHGILVGDVWLLGGQSNMQGVGDVHNGLKTDPLVRAWYMDDRWAPAHDPIHNLSDAVDPVHADLCGGQRPPPLGRWCAGPGVSFGQRMREITGVPQGLIACAHGGTSMPQWDPALKKLGGKSLYGAMLRRFHKTGGQVRGLVWYQGCSDCHPEGAAAYTQRMKVFVAAVRRDLRSPQLPLAMVQISRVIGWGAGSAPWNSVQDQQRRLQQSIRRCAVVPAIDLSLDDNIHISGEGQVRLGRRLAQAMDQLLRGGRGGKPPITLRKVTVVPVPARGTSEIVVEFGNVGGGLRAAGRPAGFTVVGPGGTSNHYDVTLRGACAIVRAGPAPAALADMTLHYGYGADPYCNLVDGADRAVPVFGPVPLGQPRALTPLVRDLRVSDFLPGAGRLGALDLPARLELTPRSFPADFCSRRPEIQERGAEDNVLYYACAFSCPQAMRLALLLGYDGPVKAWLDGREVYHDPAGTNPAVADAHPVPVAATAGRHEIVVALGTNAGRAWGVFLRFQRLDVQPRLLREHPERVVLPQVLG